MRYKVLGTNGDHDTCGRCGKTGLQRVVWLQAIDADGCDVGDAEPVGCNCAAKLMGRTSTQISRSAEQADRDAAKAARETVHPVGSDRSVVDWVIEAINGATVERMCLANGRLSLVRPWAESRFPGRMIDVRRAI